jgi:hypothetical protein
MPIFILERSLPRGLLARRTLTRHRGPAPAVVRLDDEMAAEKRNRCRFLGQSGHGLVHRTCLLLIQSGHSLAARKAPPEEKTDPADGHRKNDKNHAKGKG